MTHPDGKQWPTLFVKTAAGSINFWQIWTSGAEVHVRWGQVGTDSPQTDTYVAKGKNVGRANETSPSEQAKKEAQAKYDKQLRLKYVTSMEEAESNINIKPMLAYSLDDKRTKKLKWPVTVQPKFNGVRCLAYNLSNGTVRLMSRGGKDYTLPHIQETLQGIIPPGMCLDGELYVHRTSLQTIRHYIETPTEQTLKVQLFCYDFTQLPPDKTAWADRALGLARWFEDNAGIGWAVTLSPSVKASSMSEVEHYHDFWVSDGFEGVIVRAMEGPYRLAARSTHLLKYKKFQDDEFEVVGWDVGKDGVIIYTCKQEDGLTFDVRPMGDEEERRRLLGAADASIGQMLTVRFQERSNDNIPIFPVGVAFRPSKDRS